MQNCSYAAMAGGRKMEQPDYNHYILLGIAFQPSQNQTVTYEPQMAI